jgi:hypothetical protein
MQQLKQQCFSCEQMFKQSKGRSEAATILQIQEAENENKVQVIAQKSIKLEFGSFNKFIKEQKKDRYNKVKGVH